MLAGSVFWCHVHLQCVSFGDWLVFSQFPLEWPRNLDKISLVLFVYYEPTCCILDMAVRLFKFPLVLHCVLQNVDLLEPVQCLKQQLL